MEAVPPADREGVAKRCSNRTRRVVLTDISNQGAAVESKPSKRRVGLILEYICLLSPFLYELLMQQLAYIDI